MIGAHHALRTRRWAYMHYADGDEELYDMNIDPGQFDNLTKIPTHSSAIGDLRRQLQTHLKTFAASTHTSQSRK